MDLTLAINFGNMVERKGPGFAVLCANRTCRTDRLPARRRLAFRSVAFSSRRAAPYFASRFDEQVLPTTTPLANDYSSAYATLGDGRECLTWTLPFRIKRR